MTPNTTPDATVAPPTSPSARPRRERGRPGTVLLFALGVLAVIAVAALSYVTFVRLDRQSAAAVARGIGYERQVNIVRDYIGSLLTADLFGNKFVTRDLPQDTGNLKIRPSMFEDGEYRDFPWTDFQTFDTGNKASQNYQPSTNAILRLVNNANGTNNRLQRFEIAPRDDAWLAASEPVWITSGGRVTGAYWPQITNLRSAYTYDDGGTPNQPRDDRWVRGDGRYVDLGQLFLDYLSTGGNNRGNPGTNLLDSTLNLGSGRGVVLPIDAAGDYTRAPYEQMNWMDYLEGDSADSTRDNALEKSDERHWADTDGDLRPDARWQVLEQLGNFNGKLWVVAARITDASALVNYLAALDAGYQANDPQYVATGHTPADIDLERLLRTAAPGADPFGRNIPGIYTPNSAYPNIDTNASDFNNAFTSHVLDRMKAKEVLEKLATDPLSGGLGVLNPGDQLLPSWTWDPTSMRLTQVQRDAMWNWVGSSPETPRLDLSNQNVVSIGYPRGDMVDLCAFWGVNQRSFLSSFEETMDDPNLPSSADQGNPGRMVGPLLAASVPSNTRFFGTGLTGTANEGSPSATEELWNTRRTLTTVNGTGEVGPVPNLNYDDFTPGGQQRYAGSFFNPKISLQTFSAADVPAAYQSFVWALAPFATNETLSSALDGDDAGLQINGSKIAGNETTYFYGGGPQGPCVSLPGFENQAQLGNEGASFALLTSAELAVNLADASDADNIPTVARLLAPQQANDLGGGIYDCSSTPEIELGTAFAQGDIPPTLLQPNILGDKVTNGRDLEQACDNPQQLAAWQLANQDKGVTIVGLERHPYIMEVFSAAAYTTVSADPRGTQGRSCSEWDDQIDDAYNENYQVGALLAFHLGNPWNTDVPLSGYEIRVMKGKDLDPTGKNETQLLTFRFQNDDFIPAHRTQTYIFFYDSMGGAVSDPLIGECDDAAHPGGGPDAPLATITPDKGIAGLLVPAATTGGLLNAIPKTIECTTDFDPESKPVFFQDLADLDSRVLLVRTGVPGLGDVGAIVDRLENVDSAGKFPAIAESGYHFTVDGGLDKTAYFENVLGYNISGCPAVGDRFDQGKINGRVVVTGSLTRPSAVYGTGFPMYVMDFGDSCNALVSFKDKHVHAWLETLPFGPDLVPYTGGPECDDDDPPGVLPNGLPLSNMTGGYDSPTLLTTESNLGFETRKPAADDTFAHAGSVFNWQLFVPDMPLYAVADLGMLSTYADLIYDNKIDDLDSWRTVGQQLAHSLYYDFGAQAADVAQPGSTPNPYIGTLDFSRYIPSGNVFPPEGSLDESLSVPLATRVFDCFEPLKTWRDQTLVNGRMNINTMPARTMEALPLVAPANPGTLPGSSLVPSLARVKLVERYRSGLDPDNPAPGSVTQNTPDAVTTISQAPTPLMRRSDLVVAPGTYPPGVDQVNPSGFAWSGELAVLDKWNPATPGELDLGVSGIADERGFVSGLGLDTANDDLAGDGTSGLTDPTDDAAERLALYRAVSNLVSTRSDVFVAWFVIRGYDPDVIESIKVTQGSEIDAMESTDPEFAPAYESRWLVVYDRSNVKRPTDRPRVLLQAELPSAKP